MSTTRVIRRLFAGLLDDAAMFPPGNASAGHAIDEHLRHRRSWYADMVGPLLAPADRWQQVRAAHAAAGWPDLRVVLIGTTHRPDRIGPGLDLVGYEDKAVELPLEPPGDGAPMAAELVGPPDRHDETLDAVAASRAAGVDVIAKYRTGGETTASFPSEATVAGVISSAVRRGVPLKFTAGLHHAIRHTDSTAGFEHHGFVNLMAATRLAHLPVAATGRCASTREAARLMPMLESRDTAALVALVRGWSADDIAAVRETFRSFGCCGVEDPIGDLAALGLIDREAA